MFKSTKVSKHGGITRCPEVALHRVNLFKLGMQQVNIHLK